MKPRHELTPWRKAVLDHGLTLRQVAVATGVPYETVRAYSKGGKSARKPSDAWDAAVMAFCREQAA